MKVVVMGTHGVGKTTLLNNLRPEYKNLVIDEVIRKAVELDPNIKYNENGDAYSQKLFFRAYLNEFENRSDYISDRGLIDIVTYTEWLCVHKKTIPMGVYFNMYADLLDFTMRNRDIAYVYIPIMFDSEDDGFRATNEKYRKQIDKGILKTIAKLDKDSGGRICPFFEIKSNNLNDRIKEFESILDIISSKEHIINNYEKSSN